MMPIEQFNQLGQGDALKLALQCCSSQRWANLMIESRPYASIVKLVSTANEHWQSMQTPDFLEAFAGHPKIGNPDSLNKKYASTRSMASGEQSGMSHASEMVIKEFERLNREYEEKFGFIFIVCASGKSADEMLALIQARIRHDRNREIGIAAEEQRKITEIRMNKLFA